MIISNLTTRITISNTEYNIRFDLGLTNDHNGELLAEVSVIDLEDTELEETFSVNDFYGRNKKSLQSLTQFIEKGIANLLESFEFESAKDLLRILEKSKIYKYEKSAKLLEAKTLPNSIIATKIMDILKHNGNDMNNLVSNILGGVELAISTISKEDASMKDKLMRSFYVKLKAKLPHDME